MDNSKTLSLNRGDIFTQSQLSFNPKYVDAQRSVHNYQVKLDKRLSVPRFRRAKNGD